jgi:hypothetical protein
MLCGVLMVNATYFSNHMIPKLGIWTFLPKGYIGCCVDCCVGCHVGCHVGCLVGFEDRAKEEREGVGDDGDQAQNMT